MSVWGEPDDDVAGIDEGWAPRQPEEEADEERDSDFEGPEGEGFPDTLLAVRVWLGDDRRVRQVRVSNKWRRRLRGSTLTDRFREAFQLAYARVAPPESEGFETVAAPDPLDWSVLASLAETAEELSVAAKDAWSGVGVEPDAGDDRETLGHGSGRMVTVVLDADGLTKEVRFDESWLAGVAVGELVSGIEEAHRDAYARFAPAERTPGTYTRLVHANTALALEADAYLRRGSN